jgi:branched-chain amino acid transport system ATP-binding protein
LPISWAERVVSDALLVASNLRKSYGGLVVTDGVSIDVRAGDVHALIGPNGAGKTTLVNQLSGLASNDSGTVHFAGEDITRLSMHERARRGIVRSFQITSIIPGMSLLSNVALAVQARAGSSFRFFGRVEEEQALNASALEALAFVGLDARAVARAGALSHGEKRSLEIAIALALQPRLLLLDEPMAGTGRDETDRLIGLLKSLAGRFPMLLVEHDMRAVFSLATRVSVLVSGRIIASGRPDEIRADANVRAAYLGDEAF